MKIVLLITILAAATCARAEPTNPAPSPPVKVGQPNAGCVVLNEQSQIAQLASFPGDLRSISDKHFVLEEHQGALRERALAEIVVERVNDAEIRSLAEMVRDGHQLGIDKLRSIAAELNIVLPCNLSPLEHATLAALRALPPEDLVRFFLIRQRVMHAWDITIFTDYADAARNDELRRYIRQTLPPLRQHADLVVRISNARGISGGLVGTGP